MLWETLLCGFSFSSSPHPTPVTLKIWAIDFRTGRQVYAGKSSLLDTLNSGSSHQFCRRTQVAETCWCQISASVMSLATGAKGSEKEPGSLQHGFSCTVDPVFLNTSNNKVPKQVLCRSQTCSYNKTFATFRNKQSYEGGTFPAPTRG